MDGRQQRGDSEGEENPRAAGVSSRSEADDSSANEPQELPSVTTDAEPIIQQRANGPRGGERKRAGTPRRSPRAGVVVGALHHSTSDGDSDHKGDPSSKRPPTNNREEERKKLPLDFRNMVIVGAVGTTFWEGCAAFFILRRQPSGFAFYGMRRISLSWYTAVLDAWVSGKVPARWRGAAFALFHVVRNIADGVAALLFSQVLFVQDSDSQLLMAMPFLVSYCMLVISEIIVVTTVETFQAGQTYDADEEGIFEG